MCLPLSTNKHIIDTHTPAQTVVYDINAGAGKRCSECDTGRAENHTVQKVVCDYRYGKYSLYALTAGIVFEYDLKTGVVKDWFPSELKDDTDHLNRTIDCVKRWPEVDLLSYADHINKMKQHIEFCCHIIQQHSV